MVLTADMKRNLLRRKAPRTPSTALTRPRPTAASAVLMAVVLSLPFAALALLGAAF